MHKNTDIFANSSGNAANNYKIGNSIGQDFSGNYEHVELATVNPHSENMREFNNTRLFKRLSEKHRPKPYWKQYQGIYRAVLGTSFLFNVLSALTASAVVFFFIQGLTGSMTASLIITVVLLSVLEFMKRETSAKLFHGILQFKNWNYGLLFTVIALSAISTTASYFGAAQVVESLTPPPALADVAEQTAGIENQIAGIDQQIAAAQRNTWQGKLTARSARTVERLTESRAALTDELMRTRERTDMANDEMQSEHLSETMTNASTFAMFTLICEIALIACLFFMQHYDFRSYAEYALATNGSASAGNGNANRYTRFGSNNAHNSAPAYQNGYQNGYQNTHHTPIGFKYGMNNGMNAETENVTQTVTDSVSDSVTENGNGIETRAVSGLGRQCEHCQTAYIHGHSRQRYCGQACRISAWRKKNNREPLIF